MQGGEAWPKPGAGSPREQAGDTVRGMPGRGGLEHEPRTIRLRGTRREAIHAAGPEPREAWRAGRTVVPERRYGDTPTTLASGGSAGKARRHCACPETLPSFKLIPLHQRITRVLTYICYIAIVCPTNSTSLCRASFAAHYCITGRFGRGKTPGASVNSPSYVARPPLFPFDSLAGQWCARRGLEGGGVVDTGGRWVAPPLAPPHRGIPTCWVSHSVAVVKEQVQVRGGGPP